MNVVDLAQTLVLNTKLCFSQNKLVITLLYGHGTSLFYFTFKPLHSQGYMSGLGFTQLLCIIYLIVCVVNLDLCIRHKVTFFFQNMIQYQL